MARLRETTLHLLDGAEEHLISWETIARAALAYMSEDEVKDMCEANDFPTPGISDEEE